MAPFALGHGPRGTPKNYCESTSEWNVHEYGPPAQGILLQGYEDGNLAGDCSGQTTIDPGTPCFNLEYPDISSWYVGLCDANLDLPAADRDGHAEYARGGAWLLAGDESYDCFGDLPHHAWYPVVSVQDATWSSNVHFTVAADLDGWWYGPCGDFEANAWQHCVDACQVTFQPGADGAYLVYVGHVETSLPNVEANVPTQGHVVTSW